MDRPGGLRGRLVAVAAAAAALVWPLPALAVGCPAGPAGQAACGGSFAEAGAAHIRFSGRVMSAEDGAPIQGATVLLDSQPFTTDASGRWQADIAAAAALTQLVYAPNFQPRQTSWPAPAPGRGTVAARDTAKLPSIFPGRGAAPDAPVRLTSFSGDSGPSFQQVMPAWTTSVLVAGVQGSRGIRGDAWLANPDDSVSRLTVNRDGGGFSLTYPLDHGPGRYQLELIDNTGQALFNIPVFVGVPYQPPVPDTADAGVGGTLSEDQALSALNAIRQRHGLPPLALDPRLQAVARDHAADLAANHRLCHCWSDGGDSTQRIAAAGVQTAGGGQSPSTAEGVTLAGGTAGVNVLFASPAHRADLLGDYSHVGIGDAGQGADHRLVIEYAREMG